MIPLRTLHCLVFVVTLPAAWAQVGTHHLFPEDSASWTVDQYHSSCMGYCASVHYELKGDTLINGTGYNKLFSSAGDFFYITPPLPPDPGVVGGSFSACTYAGALRQDSAAQRIFIIPPGAGQEALLSDFSLSIGDTMPPWYDPWAAGTLVVVATDSVLVNGSYHKVLRFSTDQGGTTDLIEGVGWATGFLGVVQNPDGLVQLACFRSSTVASPAFNNECLAPMSCDLILGLDAEMPRQSALHVHPNPFAAVTTVHSDSPLQAATVTLCDMLGRTVRQLNGVSGAQFTVERQELPSGLYFLRISERNTVIASAMVQIEGR